jgi:pantoate--beta-alanine ligase
MRVYTTISSLQKALDQLPKDCSIGFVPTMGALHEGHLSLVEQAKKTCDKVVVSIFVNPTQFDKKEDLEKYPNTLKKDLDLLKEQNCDFVFTPSIKEMYSSNIRSKHFDFNKLDTVMEGAHRKGHFDGVGTIVKYLFDIVKPHFAFFGEKDFQQLQIIKKMVEKEKMSVKIIGNPIYREPDGLAMSSRNTRLTEAYREAVPFIYKTLQKAKEYFGTKNAIKVSEWVENEFEKHPILKLEYFTIADELTLLPIQKSDLDLAKTESTKKYRAFIAVFAGDIRLIDNIALY